VLKPLWLCAPAAKNGEPLYEETGHLECYKLKKRKLRRIVQVQNQLGVRTVETKKSQLLCLATAKNEEGTPTQLDDFLCYSGKFTPKPASRDVTLVDQFGILETETKAPQLLCNPAAVDGSPIANPRTHLECHKIAPRKVKVTATAVNAFGTETVTTRKAVALCVPSGKTEQVTTTTTSTLPSETTTSTILTGRGVLLDAQTGTIAAGTVLCLDRVLGGCVAGPDACAGDHLHGGIGVVGEIGTFPDPNPPACGHGQIVPDHPGCGPDDVPAC
jgi:hypothetical protein